MDTPQLIHGHPPLIEFSSSLIKLEYHVNLSCLHLHYCATATATAPAPAPTRIYPLFCSNTNGSQRVDVSMRIEPAVRPRRRSTVRGWGGGMFWVWARDRRGDGPGRGRRRRRRRNHRRARRGSS